MSVKVCDISGGMALISMLIGWCLIQPQVWIFAQPVSLNKQWIEIEVSVVVSERQRKGKKWLNLVQIQQ